MTTPQVPALSREQSVGSVDKHTCVIHSPPLSSNFIQQSPGWSLPRGEGDHGLKSLTLSSLSLALGKRELPLLIQRKCLWGERGPGDERIRHCLGPLGSSRWQN